MTEPYIPGFLAFREVNFLLEILETVKIEHPQFLPQVLERGSICSACCI